MKNELTFKIITCIVLCLGLGVASGFIAGSPMSLWYQGLSKPFFQPPSWVFGPAWTLLYTLMGISIGKIWHIPKSSAKTTAIGFFIFQFILNLLWSPVFFGLQKPIIALGIIVCMWIMIILTIRNFFALEKTAAYLLIPYLLWVSFATVLNGAIVYLN